ncbi:hypothetical protein [Paraburkholderia susongensis]|uniref:Uncharacterized protein n=1 Tax=Paraburkholderia susongensis TaxID=1515439 RepID=A0A1X7LS87_9BURK|nr:hypothetical protein [Paraburkholderia susongensis]SMG56347.1 hypothetical protein SAMN06265784_108151 [Paraburkholderia susongensis]
MAALTCTLVKPNGSPLFDSTRWAQLARLITFWRNARSGFVLQATSSSVGMEIGIAMVATGSMSMSILADFDGDAISLTSLAVFVACDVESVWTTPLRPSPS